jgi:hypothetical protein
MDPPTGNRGGGIMSHAGAVWLRSVWLPDRVKPVHLDPCLWIGWILWIGRAGAGAEAERGRAPAPAGRNACGAFSAAGRTTTG